MDNLYFYECFFLAYLEFLTLFLFSGMRCADCGYNCHEKCMPHVPKNCTKLRPVSEISVSSNTLSKASISETTSVTGGQYT